MSDRPVAEAALYPTHNKPKRRTPMQSAGFETSIPAKKLFRHTPYMARSQGWAEKE
jgi:hypothetical protein